MLSTSWNEHVSKYKQTLTTKQKPSSIHCFNSLLCKALLSLITPTVTSTHFYSWHISDIYHSEYPICTFISLITSDASGPLWEQSCGHEDTASCPEQLFCVWTLLPDPLASTDSVLAGHGTFFIARSKVLFHSLFIRAIEKRMHIYFFTYTTQGSYHNNQQCIKFTVSASLQYL